MALRTLGTTSTTILNSLNAWATSLSDADIAAIAASIADDSQFATILGGYGPGASGILCTGNTHSNTTLDTLASTGGGPLASVQRGMVVLGAGIPPGTFVADLLSGTSVQLSQAATATAAIRVAFVGFGDDALSGGVNFGRTPPRLVVPKRGVLNVLPGDRVAIDNTGWPILVSGASVGYAGSQWVET